MPTNSSTVIELAQKILEMEQSVKIKLEEEQVASNREFARNRENSMSESLVLKGNIFFNRSVKPRYEETFLSYLRDQNLTGKNAEAECVKNILQELKSDILNSIQEDDHTPENTKRWLQNNKSILLNASATNDAAVLLASHNYLNSYTAIKQIAWRNFDVTALKNIDWYNLLESSVGDEIQDNNVSIYSGHSEISNKNDAKHDCRYKLAYYYLASKDPKLLEPEKHIAFSHIIAQLADIRRAHNIVNDNGIECDNAKIDSPSCFPGTLGRIYQMGKGHPDLALPLSIRELLPTLFKRMIYIKFNAFLESITQNSTLSAEAKYNVKVDSYHALLDINQLDAADIISNKTFYSDALYTARLHFITYLKSDCSHWYSFPFINNGLQEAELNTLSQTDKMQLELMVLNLGGYAGTEIYEAFLKNLLPEEKIRWTNHLGNNLLEQYESLLKFEIEHTPSSTQFEIKHQRVINRLHEIGFGNQSLEELEASVQKAIDTQLLKRYHEILEKKYEIEPELTYSASAFEFVKTEVLASFRTSPIWVNNTAEFEARLKILLSKQLISNYDNIIKTIKSLRPYKKKLEIIEALTDSQEKFAEQQQLDKTCHERTLKQLQANKEWSDTNQLEQEILRFQAITSPHPIINPLLRNGTKLLIRELLPQDAGCRFTVDVSYSQVCKRPSYLPIPQIPLFGAILESNTPAKMPTICVAANFTNADKLEHLPANLLECLRANNIPNHALELFFLVQDSPWNTNESIYYWPAPWLHRDAPNIGDYNKESTVSVTIANLDGPLENLVNFNGRNAPRTSLHNDYSGRVKFDFSAIGIQGMSQTRDKSHYCYSLCIDHDTKTAALTLHWVLNNIDFMWAEQAAIQHSTNISVDVFMDTMSRIPVDASFQKLYQSGNTFTPLDELHTFIYGGARPRANLTNNRYSINVVPRPPVFPNLSTSHSPFYSSRYMNQNAQAAPPMQAPDASAALHMTRGRTNR